MNSVNSAQEMQRGVTTIEVLLGVLGLALLIYAAVVYLGPTPGPGPIAAPGKAIVSRQARGPASKVGSPSMTAKSPLPHKPKQAAPVAQPAFPAPGPSLSPRTSVPLAVKHTDSPKLAKLRSIQQQLQQLTASGQVGDPAKLDPVLAELEAMQGKGERLGGVDFGVVRRNLARAGEMQQLGLEIQRLAKQPGASDKPAFKQALARLQALQAQMEPVSIPAAPPLANPHAERKQ